MSEILVLAKRTLLQPLLLPEAVTVTHTFPLRPVIRVNPGLEQALLSSKNLKTAFPLSYCDAFRGLLLLVM